MSNATTAQSTAPRISQERLERIRNSLVGQIAVYEPAERAMRAPTADEAATLSNTATPATPSVVRLPGRGLAMQGDASTASFAVVHRGEDGKLVLGHDVVRKGGVHGR